MLAAGIDAGTQSVKVIVYDVSDKRIIASSSSPVRLIEKDGGVREQEASWWIDALRDCFSRIDPSIRKGICVISVSGQQHGFVPLAADGTVLSRVKLWCDTSTVGECAEIENALGGRERTHALLGNPILPGYTAGKIRWLWKNHPDLYGRMAYVLLPHDYIDFVLTGRVIMENGDASGTGLMDTINGGWNAEAVEATAPGLMQKLPEILGSPSIIGSVSKEASDLFGLEPGTKVASGGGDNMMSAIGTGAVEDGLVTMSLGTSGTLFASSSRPVVDSAMRLASFRSSTGTFLPLLCTMNCTVATETMRHLFAQDVKEFDEKAELAGPGAGGLMMLPFFNGERVPDYPHGEGVLLGMRQSNVTDGNIARAAMEGVTYEFLLGLEAFRESGMDVNSLTLTGGGARSRVWRQLAADMTGCPVRVPSSAEAAAFGAALHGVWCLSGGRIEDIVKEHILFDDRLSAYPDPSRREIYMDEYRRWLSYCEELSPLFR